MTLLTGLFISFVVGFISLSIEVLWYSLFTFSFGGGVAGSFGLILSFVLLGIALGSFFGFRLCKSKNLNLENFICAVALLSGLLIYLFIPILSAVLVWNGLIGFIFSSSTIWNSNLMFLQPFSWMLGAFTAFITYYLLTKE